MGAPTACTGTSVYYGNGTSCTPDACRGACCDAAGACTVALPGSCGGTNTYQGSGTTCTVNPCTAQLGACCSNIGACTAARMAAACTGTNTFQGFGSTCNPNPCPPNTLGPCCSPLGLCTLTLPINCALPSTFGTVGNSCSPNPCTIPTGACCDHTGACVIKPASGTGSCVAAVGVSSLAAAAGVVTATTSVAHGLATGMTVTISGASIAGFNGTFVVTVTGATTFTYVNPTTGSPTGTILATNTGETYIGNNTTCSPNPCGNLTGACCTTAGACVTRTVAACPSTTGQTFNGVGTLCAPSPCVTGACCSAAGVCSVTIASNCVTLTTNSPTFLGNGTTCAPDPCAALRGACCPNGTAACTLTISSGCLAASFGVFGGVGTTCTPTDPCASQRGACCAAAGGCTSTTALGCNGTFNGAGSVCSPSPCQSLTGACCSAVGGCTISIGTGCSGANSFRGVGTVCTPTPCSALQGACCSATGACTITTQGGCILTNNFRGTGTVCSPTPCTALLGACCTNLGACSLTISNGCTGTSTFSGIGTVCSPNDCTPTQGACCTPEGGCTLTTTLGCPSPNLWSGGTSCNPGNPCFLAAGACCIGTFCTANTAAADCTSVGGAFFFNQPCSPTPCVRPPVVISQIYCSGGEPGAIYNYDYCVLYNRGTADVDMTNWSLQYGAQSTQTFPTRVIINATIQAGHYYLIRLASVNTAVGAPLPIAPDLLSTENLNLDITAGRLALCSNSTPLSNGCPAPLPVNIVDFVGYGNATGQNVPTCSEGSSPAGGLGGVIYAYHRKASGCQDTDVNGFDFLQPLEPSPKNSSNVYHCGSTTSGACCVGESCSLVADVSACNTVAGAFAGEGTTCTPTNVCLTARGACCNGLSCSFVVQGACASPAIYSFGRACSPDPCSGSCCDGTTCTVTSRTGCLSPAYFIQGGTCAAGTCPSPVVVASGDIAYGASVLQNQDATQQIRGAGSPGPTRVGTWTKYNSLQSVRFDNNGGVLHSINGNLLGVDFGNQATGGAIYNMPTNGDANGGSPLFQFTGPNAPFGLQRSRFAGLSVSPNNDRLAVIGYDAARLFVMSYVPGATIGTGAGASIDGASQTDNNSFVFGFNITQGTTWLDNNNVIMWVQSDIASILKLYTVPVSGSGAGISIGSPVERLAIVDNKPNSSRFTSIAYNPQLVPNYLFLGSSAFQGITLNTMYVVDISGANWTLVKTVDLGTSLQTERELAIGPDRNLYLCQFAGAGQQATDPLIDRITLDGDGNGIVTAAEISAIGNNSSVDFYFKQAANTSSFNGLDIAIALGACCNGGTCSLQPPSFCTGPNGNYVGNFTTCSPMACMGACCCGSTCSLTSAAGCTGSNTAFAGAGVACNPLGNNTAPCCKGDYNHATGIIPSITVQDIFDFLAGYFSSNPCADFNGGGVSVQDIFDYLAAYFASGC